MIEIHDHLYALHTKETTYAFRVMETGQLEHLYYGRKIALGNGASLVEKHTFAPGNTIAYDQKHLNFRGYVLRNVWLWQGRYPGTND